MNISGIRPYTGYYDYNSIREIQSQRLDTEELQAGMEQSGGQPQPKISEEELAKAKENQTFGSAQYADTYQADRQYEMKGADSDMYNLDVQQALSEMQKDQVIQQYQFFVGRNGVDGGQGAQSAPVRGVEDFTL